MLVSSLQRYSYIDATVVVLTGYKIAVSCTLTMHSIYWPQPSSTSTLWLRCNLCIHPLHLWYNQYLDTSTTVVTFWPIGLLTRRLTNHMSNLQVIYQPVIAAHAYKVIMWAEYLDTWSEIFPTAAWLVHCCKKNHCFCMQLKRYYWRRETMLIYLYG